MGARAANMITRMKEIKPKKKRKAQAKYIISLTLTTEKHAKIMPPKKPRMLKPKKIP